MGGAVSATSGERREAIGDSQGRGRYGRDQWYDEEPAPTHAPSGDFIEWT